MVQSLEEANTLSAGQQIPAFYGAHMFINMLTETYHLSLS